MSFLINSFAFGIASKEPDEVSGLYLWLDANDLSTLWQDSAKTIAVTSDAEPVGAWEDKSGNGFDFIQATTGEQPTYKTNIINSKPIIRADGTEWLENLTKSNWTFLHDGSPFTVIIIYKVASNPDALFPLLGNNASSASNIGHRLSFDDRSSASRIDRGSLTVANGSGSLPLNLLSNDNAFPSGVATIMQVTYDYGISGDDGELFNAGASVASSESAATPSSSAATYDMQLFAAGNDVTPTIADIAEIMIYDNIISLANMIALTNGSKDKWGIS